MAARNSRETSLTVTRGKYAGVLSILQYNWHFYAASVCALVGVGAVLWLPLRANITETLVVA
jgi:bacteriorhodopsin